MTSADLPALYQSSDQLSSRYQRYFFVAIFLDIGLLVGASALAVLGKQSADIAILQVLILLGALACSVYLSAARPDHYWYAARAVAESVKTVSWRFAVKAEPFKGSNEVDQAQFRNVLRSIIEQNKKTVERLTSHLDRPQMTEAMAALRNAPIEERLQRYVSHRISEQQAWYAKKAAHNGEMARRFFGALVIANVLAIGCAVTRVSYPTAPYWPTDIFVSLAAALLTWIQAKRFSELSASYALAAHEISLIREQSATISTEDQLSTFVGDAENAFSREHTQWVARKDV